MKTGSTDLTKGSISGKLLRVAIPIMGTQLMQMMYNLADMFWVGRMQESTQALAATGIAGMFLWLSMSLMTFGRMGSEIGVAQNLGSGNIDEAREYAENASLIGLVLGTVFGLTLLVFSSPLLSLFKLDPSTHQAADVYLRIVAIGIPFTYLSASITGAFNGAGNSQLGFYCNALGLVINMILDPVMIFAFGWGIQGAAISTIIAQILVCVLFMLFVKRHGKRPFDKFIFIRRANRKVCAQMIRWSAPIALENGMFTLLSMVVTRMVTGYSTEALAAQRIGSQIESVSWLIGGGFASAVTAFMGQNFGARKTDRIRSGYKVSMLWLLMWEVLVTIMLLTLGEQLFRIFMQDEAVIKIGVTYLRILAFCQVFMALEGVCGGTFRGMGMTVPPSICSIVSNILRPFICYGLSLKLGLNGIWWGVTISAALRGLAEWVWFTLRVSGRIKKGSVAI